MAKKPAARALIRLGRETHEVLALQEGVWGRSVAVANRVPASPAAVAKALKDADFIPEETLLCLPRSEVVLHHLSLPEIAREHADAALEGEAPKHIPLPPESIACGWHVSEEEGETFRALLLGSAKEKIDALVASFSEAGVPVDRVTTASTALARAMAQVPAALLFLRDGETTEVALYGAGTQLGSLVAPANHVAGLVQVAQRLTTAEQTLLGAGGVSHIYLDSGTFANEELVAELEATFAVAARPLDELSTDRFNELDGAEEAKQAVPDACVLIQQPVPRELSLLKGEARKVPMRRKTLITLVLALALAAEIVIWFGYDAITFAWHRQQVSEELVEYKEKLEPTLTLRARNASRRRHLNTCETLGKSRFSPLRILEQLSLVLPDTTYLQNLRLQPGGDMELAGFSQDPTELPEVLQKLPYVGAVKTSVIGRKWGEHFYFKLSLVMEPLEVGYWDAVPGASRGDTVIREEGDVPAIEIEPEKESTSPEKEPTNVEKHIES